MPRLLVSSPNGTQGGVYLLDTATRDVRRLHAGPTRGLTRGPDGFYAIEDRGAVHRFDFEAYGGSAVTETGLRGCHDLRWIDGYFYAVASHGNRVARFDDRMRRVDELQIVADEADVCHANSLVATPDGLCLSVFTLTPGPRASKRTTRAWREDGKILRLDWERRAFQPAFEPLAQPHSLVLREGRVHVCESLRSEIVDLSLQDGVKRTLCRLDGFVRGLAFTAHRAYAGVSGFRDAGTSDRDAAPSWSGVVELETDGWSVTGRSPMPVDEVYDILVAES
jgi:hypothetical protein